MEKSADAFRTISEVAELLETPAHVLRFWESRFAQIKPLKRAGGRRYYRPADLALLSGIKKLLHDDGMTIRGVQKVLREQGVRHVAGLSGIEPAAAGLAQPAAPEHAPPGAPILHWPATPDPDAALPLAPLLHDPDDPDEAPMEVDAPTLPLGDADNVVTLAGDSPAPKQADLFAPAASEPLRPPAAAMLRAMDTLRARDKTTELRAVYNRLSGLRDRLAERSGQSRG